MSVNSKQAAKAASISLDDDEGMQSVAPARPRTAPGQLMGLQAEHQKALEEISGLNGRLENLAYREIPLRDLHEVSGRRRSLSAEEYQSLVDNLRTNSLVTPITVRTRPTGGFEIVSGHNRVAAYHDLGKPTIAAVISESDDLDAGINAFYANLLQTDLSDYEKFVGFKMIRDEMDLTQTEIAEHSGLSDSRISALMAFEELPGESLALIAENPAVLGMNAAAKLAAIARNGGQDRVREAVELLAQGTIDQARAVRMAADQVAAKPAATKPLKIKSGKFEYCSMRRAKKMLRIDFRTEEEAAEVEDAVRAVLEARAERLKITK